MADSRWRIGMTRVSVCLTALAGAAALAWPSLTTAQVAGGVRGGLSVDPDQVYVGGHLETSPLVEDLVFRPNVEIGFGDDFRGADLTLTQINLEFLWKFPEPPGPWKFYAGGGPAINILSLDFDDDDDGDTEVEAGFNFVGGVEFRRRFFIEFKAGVGESPDFKFGVGYTFR
jgi:hypothetical protein